MMPDRERQGERDDAPPHTLPKWLCLDVREHALAGSHAHCDRRSVKESATRAQNARSTHRPPAIPLSQNARRVRGRAHDGSAEARGTHSGSSGASADASRGRGGSKWHFRDRCK
jgi:hypothetical protein